MSWYKKRMVSLGACMHAANIQKARENGLIVIVWTINNQEEVSEYVKKGVDGIASDKPNILKIG